MSSKRSRILRSSSQEETEYFCHVQQIDPLEPNYLQQRAVHNSQAQSTQTTIANDINSFAVFDIRKEEQVTPVLQRRTIFTLASPPRDLQKNKNEAFGAFLRDCSLCKKTFDGTDDIFMYGYLGAYCSQLCRNYRIVLDNKGVDEKDNQKAILRLKAALNCR